MARINRESLVTIGRRICANADSTAKTLQFYAIYDRYFAELSDRAVTMLELGVYTGESLKVWASYFPQGTIIGLDLESKADFSDYSNIIFERGDQSDTNRLEEICLTHAPGGLDIILDDASHVGANSAASYAALFPHLNSGGLYIVEDWCTGYFNDWPDGKYPEKLGVRIEGDRVLSHDFGMVGFVKSLIDDVAGEHLKPMFREPATRVDTVSFAHFYKQAVILQKA